MSGTNDSNPQRTRTLLGGNIQPLASRTTIYSRPNPFGTDLGFQGTVIELVTEAQFAAGIAQDWAQKEDGAVGTDSQGNLLFSAKHWAKEAGVIQNTVANIAGQAQGSASAATEAAGRAVANAGAAANARDKANLWANAGRNVEVETGGYSAKHWALIALENAVGGIGARDVPLNPAIVGIAANNVQGALAEIQVNKATLANVFAVDSRVTNLSNREDARYNEQQQLLGRVNNLRTDVDALGATNVGTRLKGVEDRATSLEATRTSQGQANITFSSRISATEAAIATLRQYDVTVGNSFQAQNNWNSSTSARIGAVEAVAAAGIPRAGGTFTGSIGVQGRLDTTGAIAAATRVTGNEVEARGRLWAYSDPNYGLADDGTVRSFMWAEGWSNTWARNSGVRGWNRPGLQQMRLDWDGSLYVAGTGGLSDERTKHIVGKLPLDRAEALVRAARASIFTMRDDPENRLRLGPIAQDILAVAPEAMGKEWPRAGLAPDPNRGSPKDAALTLDNGNALASALSTVVASMLDRLAALESAGG